MKSVKNKVIWITGASSGIGEALSYELCKKGAELIISSRRSSELERVRAQCSKPGSVTTLVLDLNQPESLEAISKEAVSIHGKIDILINNSGISQRSLAIDTLLEVDRQIFEVNYFGTIALTKYLLPHMISRAGGHIVTVSSVAGKISTHLRSAYAASKHALHGFYDALRAEIHKNNIKVTLICPGYIKTNISFNAMTGSGESFNQQSDGQEGGMPVEVCARKIINAIEQEKSESYIAGSKERLGLFVKRFFPKMMPKLLLKMKTT